MPDPTPVLSLGIALRAAGATLIAADGAARECHNAGISIREPYLREVDRALSAAADAIYKYRMAQVDALRERNSKLMEPM